jgi:hypothetical protein
MQKTLIQELHVRREALVILIYSKNYSQLIVNDHPRGNAAGGEASGSSCQARGESRARPESN